MQDPSTTSELHIDKLYSPQMVATIYNYKYTIENDLTEKKKERKKHTNKWHAYLSKQDMWAA